MKFAKPCFYTAPACRGCSFTKSRKDELIRFGVDLAGFCPQMWTHNLTDSAQHLTANTFHLSSLGVSLPCLPAFKKLARFVLHDLGQIAS